MYQTGIPDVYVVLIEESEEFLDNEKLKFTEYEESTIYGAELLTVYKLAKTKILCVVSCCC